MNLDLAPAARQLLSRAAAHQSTAGAFEDRLDQAAGRLAGMPPGEAAGLRQALEEQLWRLGELQASDLDLGGAGSGGRLWLRIHGEKRPRGPEPPLSLAETDVWILSLLSESQHAHLRRNRNLDFSYSLERGSQKRRYRGDAYVDLGHLALNLRAIQPHVRPLADLGLHPLIARSLSIRHVKRGLVLVTGITGSGKSSTLDSIVDANNQTADAHIVIIGSPIEYVHASRRCIVRHREVGADVASFRDGAVQALRQDPDIIVIGEMRDEETITTALEVTDSGHKVFSTLHTSSAVESIDRIVAECPVASQERVRTRLADVLGVVMSQKLVPDCAGRRVLAKEVLAVTASVRAAIKNGNTGEVYQMIAEGSAHGMITLEQDLKRLCDERWITPTAALDFANDKRRMEQLLRPEGL